jgi:hypothetical protein
MDEEEEFELDETGDYGQQLEQLSLKYSIPNAIGAMARMSRSTEESRARLQEARARILARQYDKSIPWFAAGAALGAPTKTGSFGETLSNLNDALAGPRREQMAFNRQKDEDLLGVDTALLGMDSKSLDAAVKLAQLRAKMQDPSAWRLWKKYKEEVRPEGDAEEADFFEVLRASPQKIEDINLGKEVIDPTGRRPTRVLSTTTSELDAASKKSEATAEGSEIGKSTAQAKIDLPAAEASAKELTDLLTTAINHPGMPLAVGATSLLPIRPGSDEASFQAIWEQIGGSQFLAAYDKLRGTGQITQAEGQEGKNAIARMQKAQKEKDFKKAAQDFITHVNGIVVRLRGKADNPPETQAEREAGALPRVRNNADFRALPSNTEFIDPQGKKRRKP